MDDKSSAKILVLGSYNVDLTSLVTKFPKPGETITGLSFQQGPGGKGSNQAIAAARLDGQVSFMCCLGDDSFASEALEMFTKEKMDTQYIKTAPRFPTGTAIILVDESGENQIVVTPGANHQLSPNDLKQTHFKDIDWLVLQMEVPFETVKRAVEVARAEGVKIILNPAPVMKEIIELLPLIDILTPNETEAEVLTGIAIQSIQDAEKAAIWLLAKGTKAVSITMGSNGVYIANYVNGVFVGEHVPAVKVKAVDTTGAGDCFNGALAVALSEGDPFPKAVRFAVKAASISVQRKGAGSSMPYKREI